MDNREITVTQLAVILISTNIGVSMLAFPRFVVVEAETASILATSVGACIALIGIIAVSYLGKTYRNKTFVGYSQSILGKKIGSFFSLMIIVLFIILTGLELRQFGEVVIGALLPKTPIIIPMMIMAFICLIVSLHSVNIFAYIHFFYIGFTVAPILFILVASISEIDWVYIQPLLGNETTWSGFMNGAIVVTKIMLNFFVISIVIPFMRQPEKAILASLISWGIVTILFISSMFFSLAIFGSIELEYLMWPILVLGRLVRIPAEIFQRLDAILLVAWLFAVFTTLYSTYFFIVRATSELISSVRHRIMAVTLFLIVFLISLYPKDIYEMYELIKFVSNIGIIVVIGYPFFLIVVHKMKGSESTNETF